MQVRWQDSEGDDCGIHIASLVFDRNKQFAAFSGDPKARVITLKRRSKKRPAAVVVFFPLSA
jgi:hypothetical protein